MKTTLKICAAVYFLGSIPPVFYTIYKFRQNYISESVRSREQEKQAAANRENRKPFTDYRLVAHAGGALFNESGAMLTYTNSQEAVLANYKKGHRVFELDFTLTDDGFLAAVHDWKSGRAITGSTWEKPTLREWKDAKIHGTYTPMDINDVMELLAKHEDMYIVTDTKETAGEIITKQFTAIVQAARKIDEALLDRVIPQIYVPAMLETVYEIHAFPDMIYTLYQSYRTDAEVLRFVEKHPAIKAVCMQERRATKEFVSEIGIRRIVTYVHTVDRFTEALDIANRGVHGLYTNCLY
jgi:glycerophosphoryl diester phosphodiesterase